MSFISRMSFETKVLYALFTLVLIAFLALFAYMVFFSPAAEENRELQIQTISRSSYDRLPTSEKNRFFQLEIDHLGSIRGISGVIDLPQVTEKIAPGSRLLISAHPDCPAELIEAIISRARTAGAAAVWLRTD